MKLIKCKHIILFFVIAFLGIVFFFKDANFIYFCTLCVWVMGVFFCLKNVRKRLLMLLSLLSFYLFIENPVLRGCVYV